jgi:glycosyltransferase involved in cell wall biosynthesis
MKKIAAFTTGLHVPSARFRIRQLVGELSAYDIFIKEYPAITSSYAPPGLLARFKWFPALLADRANNLRLSADSDLVIFQKELISTLPSFEIFFGEKAIFDVDDAIWLNKLGLSSRIIAKNVGRVVVANKFLAAYYERYNKNVHVVPTAVDIDKFSPRPRFNSPAKFVIGWSGTSGGYRFFSDRIQKQLNGFMYAHRGCLLRITSDSPPSFEFIDKQFIEFVPWTSKNESKVISTFDVGIMPLDSSTWSQGKSSYKMLLYMACGVPVIASPVGMNNELLMHPNSPGLSAGDHDSSWHDSLKRLYEDVGLRELMASNGRRIVVDQYSIKKISSEWARIILSCF